MKDYIHMTTQLRATREFEQRQRIRFVRESITWALKTIFAVVMAGYLALALAFFGLNWASGCGETFTTAEGTIIHGQCIRMAELITGE